MDAHLVDRLRKTPPETLGGRIKSARIAAGLTQAAMADGDVTISFVSRIESGKRRPDPLLLERFATRVGLSTEDLLSDYPCVGTPTQLQLDLDFAELALEMGDAASALVRLDDVLHAHDQLSPTDTFRACFLRARALETEGDLVEAIDALEALTATSPAAESALAVGIALSRCYREAGELNRAILSGEALLTRLSGQGLGAVDETIQLTVTVAAAYFEQGDISYAVRLCRRAIRAADADGSTRARASAYWNAGIMEVENGNVATAVTMARKALALLGEGQDARNLARLRTELGGMQLRLDPPEVAEASDHLRVARDALLASSASALDLHRNSLSLARCALLDGDLAEAQRLALETATALEGSAPILVAQALSLAGQAAAGTGDSVLARRHLLGAVHTLTGIGADRFAAQLWMDLAGLLEAMDEQEAARDAYRNAAASTGLVYRSSQARVEVPTP